MSKIVVTTGQPFTDIDALACAISYTELLKTEGEEVESVLPGPLNKSVTQTVRNWGLKFSKNPAVKNSKYVLVDISEPKFFAEFVTDKDITEVYDHRYGFGDYWKKKLGDNSHIEMVGSCATLIWEEIKKRMKPLNISVTSSNLLLTAIVSNTLNFKASVTTKRDVYAYRELLKFSKLPKDWIKKYFEEQEKESLRNPLAAITNDAKGDGYDLKIGQLEFWDSKIFLFRHLKEIEKVLGSFGNEKWFFTSPSISEGINYLYTKQENIKELLKKTIKAKFRGDMGTTGKLWLRKEIIQKINEQKI